MLIEFKVRNFRSILNELRFTYAPGGDRAHESTHRIRTGMKSVPMISRVAVVFGPNAGGKTNLLLALATFRDLVLHSTSYSDTQLAERHTPFRLHAAPLQPTEFEIDVLLDRIRYRYWLSYDCDRILGERLLVYHTGKSQRWFERCFDAATQADAWAPYSPNFNGPREMWRKATRPQALFLTVAAQLNSEQLAPLMHWVEHSLEILIAPQLGDATRVASQLQNERFKVRVMELLRAVDMPVEDIRVAPPVGAQPRTDESKASRVSRPVLEFMHAAERNRALWFDSVFEAAGTHRVAALLGPLLAALDHGKLLVIDEFDTSLHPLVARFLIQLFIEPTVSKRAAQLLLVSHNSALMDQEILSRDEIWLMQLDERRTSVLLPLMRSSPRKHELIAKSYLKGRYGAVPRIQFPGRASTDLATPRG